MLGVIRRCAELHSKCIVLANAGAEAVHEIVLKANEWLESMEGHLKEQLVASLWAYYLFMQTAEAGVDWSQPLVTVFQGIRDSRLWEAAQTCGCLGAVLQELSTAILQYAGMHPRTILHSTFVRNC
jgi:hypothetical protein